MKAAVYSFHKFEKYFLEKANAGQHEIHFFDTRLSIETALLSAGFDAVSLFVNDDASEQVLEKLHQQGIRLLLFALPVLIMLILKKQVSLAFVLQEYRPILHMR